MTKQEYLADPCRASSIPYWKAAQISIPDTLLIVHESGFDKVYINTYIDELYFRLMHDLRCIPEVSLPDRYEFSAATPAEFADHINLCYGVPCMSEQILREYAAHPVYCKELWLAIRDRHTGELGATGIGELDAELGEGILEWIQVAPSHRRRGLGSCVVCELLRRMQGRAAFATVSGKLNDPVSPESMYRKCGFTGDDIWHILRKR